ncbi:S1 RNA binding domain protein, partial [Vibrio parahaemolyticus V-223/04]
TSLK